jgi:hypothetical protein
MLKIPKYFGGDAEAALDNKTNYIIGRDDRHLSIRSSAQAKFYGDERTMKPVDIFDRGGSLSALAEFS